MFYLRARPDSIAFDSLVARSSGAAFRDVAAAVKVLGGEHSEEEQGKPPTPDHDAGLGNDDANNEEEHEEELRRNEEEHNRRVHNCVRSLMEERQNEAKGTATEPNVAGNPENKKKSNTPVPKFTPLHSRPAMGVSNLADVTHKKGQLERMWSGRNGKGSGGVAVGAIDVDAEPELSDDDEPLSKRVAPKPTDKKQKQAAGSKPKTAKASKPKTAKASKPKTATAGTQR